MTSTKRQRLQSLDALRGFDMMWILGGEKLFAALFAFTGWVGWTWFDQQMHHSQWHGFTFYDLIFPLFIFLSGVALGLSVTRVDKLAFEQRKARYIHAVKRLGLLIAAGIIYNHGWGAGLPADAEQVRYASVLARIAFAWFFAAMLIGHTSVFTQILTVVTIIVGYGALHLFVVGGHGQVADFTLEGSINAMVDAALLPGMHYQQLPVDPEGVLSTLPAIANAIIGSFVGRFIVKPHSKGEWAKVTILICSGVAAIALGQFVSALVPINKTLWTSSFVLVSCGWSVILFAVFYGVVDVLKWRNWAFILTVIGTNAIAIYLASSLVNWHYLAASLAGGFIAALPETAQPLAAMFALLTVQWLVLYWLYKRQIFIKI
ncbi:DUF5009 domain-containing protein [Shewanella intestini]|uniref:DUF5009 domain-containing protein n=2 Tax=Shewanellaceae TaxID=267890 RepID=A0ABS5HYK0_9GAMM|nr:MULTISPECIES: DUF5009 domain-containing protein [Shewanella]MBR9726711.1 DUF5009 domain-containing protein [Shewanella intestini]